MAIITARVNDTKKAEAQKIADELWISISTLINMWINNFIRTKEIHFSLNDTDSWYYNDPSAIDVNEDAATVLHYLESITDTNE